MPFNGTQKELYQLSLDFLVGKLDAVLEKSKSSQSALNAACFLLHVTLKYDRSNLEKMADILYPEKKYQIVKNIFLEIHDVITFKRSDHRLIKSITDPRFFASQLSTPEYKGELQQTISTSLKKDLGEWLNQQYETQRVSNQTILDLERLYSQSALGSASSGGKHKLPRSI